MNSFETFQSDAVQRPIIQRRLFWGLVVSLIIHAGIVYWFRQTPLPQFSGPTERLVPRIFNVKNITISDKLLQNDDKQETEKKADNKPLDKPALKPLDIPDEKPVITFTEGKMAPLPPSATALAKPIASDKPIASANDALAITRAQDSAAKVMEQDLNSLKDSLLRDQPATVSHSKIHLPDSGTDEAARNDTAGMAAASGRLDALLGHGLHAGDAPVTMPGGAVFEFGSADLKADAAEQLRKLGTLIKQNPNVTFTIEGYTDSFGDTAYNEQLSQARADAVRAWLVQNMEVDPTHIQAHGYGATNFLVQPKPVNMRSQPSIDAEKLLEQSNRRVEIRFKFPKQ